MTTATPEAVRFATARTAWTRLLPPVAGIGLVVGLFLSFNSPVVQDSGDTPAEVVATVTDNKTWTVVVLVYALASVGLAGGFVAGLYTRLRGVATELESSLVLIGGIVFAACFPLALIFFQAPLADMPDDHARALAQAEAYLTFDDAAWVTLAAAGVGAALMAVPASLAAIRSGVPKWLGWLGILAGIVSLATFVVVGIIAWALWILVASIVLLAARET